MLKYIAKRIGLAVVTIWAVATITFFLMNMVPGGGFLSEKAISPQAQAALEAKYGLDKPLFQQYITYLTDALHGDFGDSLKQRPYRNVYYTNKIPRFSKSRRDIGIGCPMYRDSAGMYRRYPERKIHR